MRAIMRRGMASGELAAPVEMVCSMYRLWEGRGYAVEMANWLEEVLVTETSKACLPPILYACALCIAGKLQELLALDLQKGFRYYEQSLMISRSEQDHNLASAALFNLAFLHAKAGNYALARSLNEEALTLSKEHGLRNRMRSVLSHLAEQLSEEGAFEAAWMYAERALQLAEEMAKELEAEGGGVAIVLSTMGTIALYQEKHEAAREYLGQALAIWDELGNNYWQTRIWGLQGTLALKENNLETAERLLLQALHACAEQHIREQVPANLDRVAELRFTQGYTLEAVGIYAAVDTFNRQFGLVRPPVEAPKYEQILASARQQLGDAVFASAWKEGEAWELFDLADKVAREQSGWS